MSNSPPLIEKRSTRLRKVCISLVILFLSLGIAACKPKHVITSFPNLVLDAGAVEWDGNGRSCDRRADHKKTFSINFSAAYRPKKAKDPVSASSSLSQASQFNLSQALTRIVKGPNQQSASFEPDAAGPFFDTFNVSIDKKIVHSGAFKVTIKGRGTCKGVDTDGDGIDDHIEDPDGNGYTAGEDTDFDGVIGPGEDLDGDGVLDSGETDLNNPDTDGDGIFDGLEKDNELNPLLKDTDGDGIIDGIEDKNQNGRKDPGEKDPRDPLN